MRPLPKLHCDKCGVEINLAIEHSFEMNVCGEDQEWCAYCHYLEFGNEDEELRAKTEMENAHTQTK